MKSITIKRWYEKNYFYIEIFTGIIGIIGLYFIYAELKILKEAKKNVQP